MRKWNVCTTLSALLLLHGCATSNALKTTAVSERNIDNLSRLNLGMSEDQVLRIMRDPYKDESFQLSEDQYDVWLYVTQPTVLGQTRMVPFNLTPLIFRNKILVGTGYGYYNWLKDRSNENKQSTLSPEENKIKESIKNQETSVNSTVQSRVMPELLSMSSPQKTDESPSSPKELTDPPPPKSPPAKKDIEINEEDEKMLQDESDQNFNFW